MDSKEKLHYKPFSILEILKRMKNLSEFLIDLGFSAVLFNNKDLADELLNLEEEIDYLTYLLWMQAALATRDAEDAEQMVGIVKVGAAVDQISNVASDFAHIIKENLGIHPLAKEVFEKVKEQYSGVKISENSALARSEIGKLNLETKIGVDIIGIRRHFSWIVNPEENETLRPGDLVIFKGSDAGIEIFGKLARGELKRVPEIE